MELQLKLSNGVESEWYYLELYDDFNEMAEAFVEAEVDSDDYDDIDEYIEDNVFIDDIDDEFTQSCDTELLSDLYTEPFGDDHGVIHDWDELKSIIETLQLADKHDVIDAVLIYYDISSCADLEQAYDHVHRQGVYCGYWNDTANFARQELDFLFSENDIPTILDCNIDWDGVWDDLSSDFMEENGHIFRII